MANHLNDISRDHPDLVVETAARWMAAPDANTERLVKTALRTLIKKGDAGALGLLGFAPAAVEIDGPMLDRTTVGFGESVRFSALVRNVGDEPARLAIDYIVYHQKANGTLSGKTFKLTTQTLAPGASLEVGREHSFRAITTRRYHPGAHAITLQINGVETPRAEFGLRAADADAGE